MLVSGIALNPLKAELNPICHLLTLLGAHHIFHVSGLRVKVDWYFHIDVSGKTSWPLKMGATGFIEKSILSYHFTLRNITKSSDLFYTAAEVWSHSNKDI